MSSPAAVLVLVTSMLAWGCGRESVAPPPSDVAPRPPTPTTTNVERESTANASVAFCAFGGGGPMPIDASADAFVRVVAIVDVDVTGDQPFRGVNVSSIALTSANGEVEASMRDRISVLRVSTTPAAVDWGTALRREGSPFDGTLGPGRTRLRVEAWLTRSPRTLPARARVVLAGDRGSITADGSVAGQWPTG